MKRAVLLILEKDRKILFARRAAARKSLPGRWSLPSGTMEENETKEEAAIREAKEELNLDLRDFELFDTYEMTDKILYFFKAPYTEELKIKATEELTELKEYSWEDFFNTYKDEEIGHGLQYLREKVL